MPKLARAIYDPTQQKWWDDIGKAGDDERVQRKAMIDRNWQYYHGDHPLPLKIRHNEPDFNVILSLVEQAVDSMVSFLGVPALEVVGAVERKPDTEGVLTVTKSPAQEALELLWDEDHNDLTFFILDLLLSGAIAGHNFLKLIEPRMTGEPGSVELIDPRYMTVYWLNHRTPLFYRMKWVVDEDETRVQDIVPNTLLARRDDAGELLEDDMGWTIIEYAERKGNRPTEIGRDAWDYPFAPIVDWKNSPAPFEYYGRSDISPAALRKNNAANLTASSTQKIIFHHAGPQTVVTGGKLDEAQDSGPGKVIAFEDKDTKVYNLEMASDLVSSMSFMNLLRGAFFENLSVVDRASIKDKLGDLTNFAVRLLYGAQSDAGDTKQEFYGRGIAKATRHQLLLMGAIAETDKVIAKWDAMLPTDRKEVVESIEKEAKLGMTSEQTLLEELGRDPAVEAEQKAEEGSREQDQTAELLVRMGNQSQGGFANANGAAANPFAANPNGQVQ